MSGGDTSVDGALLCEMAVHGVSVWTGPSSVPNRGPTAFSPADTTASSAVQKLFYYSYRAVMGFEGTFPPDRLHFSRVGLTLKKGT